jgi:hypothetical protein
MYIIFQCIGIVIARLCEGYYYTFLLYLLSVLLLILGLLVVAAALHIRQK